MSNSTLIQSLYLTQHRKTSYLIGSIIFVLITIILIILGSVFSDKSIWDGLAMAGGNALEFCEENHWDKVVVQPANTWSNLGFLIVGLFMFVTGINDLRIKKEKGEKGAFRNLLAQYPVFSFLMGLSCIYLFLGSFLYHASVRYLPQKLDITSMYFLTVVLMAFSLFRSRFLDHGKKREKILPWLIIAVIIANTFIFIYIMEINVNVLFPFFILTVFIGNLIYALRNNLKKSMARKALYLSFAVLAISFVMWILDREDIMCNSGSIFQGHAIWHVLNALSIFLIYSHYRSDTRIDDRYQKAMG